MFINNLSCLTSAFEFAARKHTKQRRKGAGNIPYINHPIEVVNLLAFTMASEDIILLSAAALHDTVEDTETTFEELNQQFGESITALIREVTDDMSLSRNERKSRQIEHAPQLSEQARLIKIADKTCNVLDILTTRLEWTKKMKKEYISWARELVNLCRGVNPKLENEFDKALKLAHQVLGDF